MIQANELRIGNLVWMISKQKNYTIYRGQDLDNSDDFEPILLTEKILLKCGCESDGNDVSLLVSDFLYSTERDRRDKESHSQKTTIDTITIDEFGGVGSFWISIENEDGNRLNIDISRHNYLHQLQNLYFALTGTELEYINA